MSVRIKVVAEEETEVKKGLMKQDYWISDATGCVKIVTWEENTGLLNVDKCYKLCGLLLRTYRGKNIYLFREMGSKFVILKILVWLKILYIPAEQEAEIKLSGVSVAGVKYFEKFEGC